MQTQTSHPLITLPRAVVQQALEALEERHVGALREKAMDALKAALEQLEQEAYTDDVSRKMREAGMTFHLGMPHAVVMEQMTRFHDLVCAEASIKAAAAFANQLRREWRSLSEEEIATAAVHARLHELALLSDGWFDGDGLKPSGAGLAWFSNSWTDHWPPGVTVPYIYPTLAGGLQLEWSFSTACASVDVDLTRRAAELIVSRTADGEVLDERALDLTAPAGWQTLTNVVLQHENAEATETMSEQPEALRTPEVWLEAVRQDGMALKHVPDALRTPEVCLEAVRQNGEALYYVPEPLRTLDLYLEAVRQIGSALQYVPDALRTPEWCLEAVRQTGWALQHVPEALRTPELCLEAVRQNGYALRYVPEPLRTPELCLEAVRQNYLALGYVPYAMRTPELCLEAVRQNGRTLKDVPAALRTPDLYVAALEQRLSIINDLSNEELSTPVVSRWVDEHWGAVVKEVGEGRARDIAQTILIKTMHPQPSGAEHA